MFDALSGFLNVNGYIPHGYCLSWSQPLVLTFVVSDLLIFFSYSALPVALAYFAQRRKDFPYQWVLWMFAAFIMFCGLTHLMDAAVLWFPLYGLAALLKATTAIVSFVTAIALWPLIPQALKIPSPAQLQQSNEMLQNEIVERKRVEEALRIAKQQVEDSWQNERMYLAAIVESSEDAIIGQSLDGIITSWNRAAEKIFGYPTNQIIGESVCILIPTNLREDEQRTFLSISDGKAIQENETLYVSQDGRQIAVSVTLSPIRNKDGEIIGASRIVRDITNKKLAEQQIRDLNANLERRVSERTAELMAANRELDAFAYAVSHDLRAPLRALCGFSQALIEDYGAELQDDATVYLQQIDIASRKMSELIDGLLVLSRSTRGEFRQDRVDISGLSGRLLAEMAGSDPQWQVAVQVEAGLQVQGDERMIEVVMRNLLGNAWKYTAKAIDAHIRVYGEQHDGHLRICVADTGAGFDMAHANRLFQPFQRLHRQEEFPGIGIGLATVQRIIHRHGGVITAQGEPGKGAVFCFTLPDRPATTALAE